MVRCDCGAVVYHSKVTCMGKKIPWMEIDVNPITRKLENSIKTKQVIRQIKQTRKVLMVDSTEHNVQDSN